MNFYDTIVAIQDGKPASHSSAKILKEGIQRIADSRIPAEKALDDLARETHIPVGSVEMALEYAVFQAAEHACPPKTQTSAKTWLSIYPESPIQEQWKALTNYSNDRSCCGGCPLVGAAVGYTKRA